MNPKTLSLFQAVLSWPLVLVPLGWGVWKSIEKSMPLFQGDAIITTAPPPPTTEKK